MRSVPTTQSPFPMASYALPIAQGVRHDAQRHDSQSSKHENNPNVHFPVACGFCCPVRFCWTSFWAAASLDIVFDASGSFALFENVSKLLTAVVVRAIRVDG